MPYWTDVPKSVSYFRDTGRLGDNLHVAILDQGIYTGHTDEFGSPTRVTRFSDTVGDSGVGYHGTACAGIIGGATSGFLPNAHLLDGKCFDDDSTGTSLGAITDCMDDLTAWAEAPGNVAADEHVIVNCSFGAPAGLGGNGYATAVQAMEDAGIAVFAASGNLDYNLDSSLNFFPAHDLEWGAVGAVDLRRVRTHFSNYGGMVKLHALGWGTPAPSHTTNGAFINFTGTSAACPAAVGCYGTWATSRDAPRSQAEVWALQEEYIAGFCKKIVRKNAYDTEYSNANVFLARADGSIA